MNHESHEPRVAEPTTASDEGLEPIAIIAMNGRFPGAKTVEAFWENLCNGIESVTIFTDEDLSQTDQALLKNPNFARADAVLEDIDLFDAAFFNYSPREAEIMDPQHRLFLECAWEAFELAGYHPGAFDGRIGVYAGANSSSYLIRNLMRNKAFVESVGSFQTMLGNSQDFLATKVSYKLDLMGPSVNTNTLCSSSMVGVHFACQALWNYQIDMALAGGVSIQVSRNEAMFYQEGGIGSFDGHCRAFDAKAGGTVSGSGLGLVILKRLEDASAAGDTIHALIRGSALNNDGGQKMSYTAPSVEGQAEVIAEAQAVAGIHPETISYVEAHGTGTSLGDPVEITGLTKAFRYGTDKKGFCGVGSVKTNIGHLVTAGGLASLIKTVESLKHRQIPPSLNFEEPNPKIDFENSPFFVVTELMDWNAERPRRAGVSSFGIGGTNSHLIVEEAPEVEPSLYHRSNHLLVLSARSESALERTSQALVEYLLRHPESNLGDVAFTLQLGRKPHTHRRVLVCDNREEALSLLRTPGCPQVFDRFQENEDRPVVFMFSGQGSQYVNMGAGLYETEPEFRKALDRCASLLEPHLGENILTHLFAGENDGAEASARLQQTTLTQPILFSLEYALATMWMAWGIRPQALIGHSIGEYTAACLAGVFSLEDALALVAARGRMIQNLPPGDMLAVSLSEDELAPQLGDALSLAAVNGPSNCVVSGESRDIDDLAQNLEIKKVAATKLHTSHAFHSHMMEPLLKPFSQRVRKILPQPPQIPFISNVSGHWITDSEATDPGYWARHLRETVQFEKGLRTLFEEPERVLLEVGPSRTLSGLAKQHPQKPQAQTVLTSLRRPRDPVPDQVFLLDTLGQLFLAGVRVDWAEFHGHERGRRIPLPTYPFERQRYWIEPDMTLGEAPPVPMARSRDPSKPKLRDWFYLPSWKKSPLPARTSDRLAPRTVLIFVDPNGLGHQTSADLTEAGNRVITVTPGPSFAKLETDVFTLRPENREDYTTLFQRLTAESLTPKIILHMWSMGESQPGRTPTDRFREAQVSGFYSLLFLANAINQDPNQESCRVWIVTSHVHEITGPPSRPEKATIMGASRVIPHECPEIQCSEIDVAWPKSTWERRRLAANLAAEICWGGDTGATAYRDGSRWKSTFEPIQLDPVEKLGLRNEGAYLVLATPGGPGAELAAFITANSEAAVVLAEPGTPDRAESSVGLKLREESGLFKVTVEMAAEGELAALLCELENRFEKIHGILFAVGLFGKNAFLPLDKLDVASGEAHFQAKAYPLLALENALGNRELDFCVVFSSLSTTLGGLGLSAYAAANGFTDAFVREHNRNHPVAWTCLSWDGWQNEVQGAPEQTVNSDRGLEALKRVLQRGGLEQVLIFPQDLNAWLARQAKPRAEAEAEANYTVHPRPNLQTPYQAPQTETEKKVAEIWRQRLGVDQVGLNDNFFELGGDSLIVVKIRRALQESFGMDLLTSDLFEHPTVGAVASYLEQERQGTDFGAVRARASKRREAMEERSEELIRVKRRRRRYDSRE